MNIVPREHFRKFMHFPSSTQQYVKIAGILNELKIANFPELLMWSLLPLALKDALYSIFILSFMFNL